MRADKQHGSPFGGPGNSAAPGDLLGGISAEDEMPLRFECISAYVKASLQQPSLGSRLGQALSAERRAAAQQEQGQVCWGRGQGRAGMQEGHGCLCRGYRGWGHCLRSAALVCL